MGLRLVKVVVAVLLGASGALMYAASWQRWAGACPWGDGESQLCSARQDHLYDFLPPTSPWEPVGTAAQLAGCSLLVLAVAFVVLPWALTGRRPGPSSAVALAISVVVTAIMAMTTLQSGLTGRAAALPASDLVLYGWAFVPPALLVRWAVAARGWAMAAAIFLVLGTPMAAALSYAIGPYDARPWWEGISGAFTVIGGACLLADAVFGGRFRSRGTSIPSAERLSPTTL